MRFNNHSRIAGQHAFLSASKYSWLNYDEEKLLRIFDTATRAARGSRLHSIAQQLISEGLKMPNNTKTLNMYVNDAIGYRMTPEVVLFYSENVFGTVDAISFSVAKMILRISDLKTGEIPASVKQLLIYAALFCLEYGFDPNDLRIELRIYQNDEVQLYEGDGPEIKQIMQKIKRFDEVLKERQAEVFQ